MLTRVVVSGRPPSHHSPGDHQLAHGRVQRPPVKTRAQRRPTHTLQRHQEKRKKQGMHYVHSTVLAVKYWNHSCDLAEILEAAPAARATAKKSLFASEKYTSTAADPRVFL